MPVKQLAAALLALLITHAANSAEVKTTVKYDEYSKTATLATESIDVEGASSGFLDVVSASAWFAATVADRGSEVLRLCIQFESSNGWAFFTSATDIDGVDLPVTVVDRRLNHGSNVTEVFIVNLTQAYLAAHREGGVNIKFYGKARQMVVKMPSRHVQVFELALTPVREGAQIRNELASASPVTTKVKLGVKYISVTDSVALALKQASKVGVVIMEITPGSVAAAAGFAVGDVVLSVAGNRVEPKVTGLAAALVNVEPGHEVFAVVWRAGVETKLLLKF